MKQIIWTNHAEDRIKKRKISQNQIIQTINSPDSKIDNADGSKEFARESGSQKIHVIVKENENGEYIILSCWINPPNYGTADFKNNKFRKDMKKASGIKKVLYTLINQLGL